MTSFIGAPVTDYTWQQAPSLFNRSRARQVCEEAGVDALIATRAQNVAYVSGYYCLSHWTNAGTLGFAVVSPADSAGPTVVTGAMEVDAWVEEPPTGASLRLYGQSATQVGRVVRDAPADLTADDRMIHDLAWGADEHADALATLVRAVEEMGLARATLALDESGLTYHQRQAIVAALPHATVVDGAALFKRVRMVKTPAEVERLTWSTRLAGSALRHAMALVGEGFSEREFAAAYNGYVGAHGGESTFAVVNFGRRSGRPHSLASDYRAKPGDVLKYDVGCRVGMYQSDIGRTQVVGTPPDEVATAYQAILAGEQHAIAAIRPGVRPSEIFDIAVRATRDAGLPDFLRHHTGHGIGIDVYDDPVIQSRASALARGGAGPVDEPLEAGAVINIETPYYLLGRFGLIVEDTLLVTDSGARYLTDLPRGLWSA